MSKSIGATMAPPGAVNAGRVIDNVASTTVACSDVHGFGLFATRPIPRGTVLGLLDGQVLDLGQYETLLAARNASGFGNGDLFCECNFLGDGRLEPLPRSYLEGPAGGWL